MILFSYVSTILLNKLATISFLSVLYRFLFLLVRFAVNHLVPGLMQLSEGRHMVTSNMFKIYCKVVLILYKLPLLSRELNRPVLGSA